MNWIALDIGGANLKVADGKGYAASFPFALWKDARKLSQELRTLLAECPPCDHLAITMTGELADCFESKQEGVEFIIEAITQAADGRHTRVYCHDGRLVAPQVARQESEAVAASNWHVLGRFVSSFAPEGWALLVDIGSTTTDLLPLLDGELKNVASDDTSRMICGELVYTGVERTPLCALLNDAAYRGSRCPLAAELFATTLDAYLLSNDLPENALKCDTADGRPATKPAARLRVGRLLGAPSDFNHRDAVAIALEAIDAQVEKVVKAAEQVMSRMAGPLQTVVVSGHGDFLAKKVLDTLAFEGEVVSLRARLGKKVARCAPAHALAVLAEAAR